MSLEEFARDVGLSETRLRALFKSNVGLSPTQYVKKMKMDEAAKLLRETHKKVTEIATQLHVNSVSHFTTDFKKAYGMTPTQYRKHCRRRSEEEGGT